MTFRNAQKFKDAFTKYYNGLMYKLKDIGNGNIEYYLANGDSDELIGSFVNNIYWLKDQLTFADHDSRNATSEGGIHGLFFDGTSLKALSENTWYTVGTTSAGDVSGPSSAVDGNIATFDGITGKIIKDSGYGISLISGLPTTYLKLDASNDPLQGDLDHDGYDIDNTGNVTPKTDNTHELGSALKTYSNAYFTDEYDTPFSARQLAQLHREYSEEAAILPYSIDSSVSGGVWTITLTDESGAGFLAVVLNGKTLESASSTLSVNATSYAGTDLNPKTVYVYIQNNGSDMPELIASNTSPEGIVDHVHVANYKAGTVGTSDITIYGKTEDIIEMYKTATHVYHRFYAQGALYETGLAITATSTDVTIGTGTYKIIFDSITTDEKQVSIDGLYYVKNDGTYNEITDFSFGGEYSDGVTIGNNKYFNIVLGVMQDDTTRIVGLIQAGTSAEYSNFANAYRDIYAQTVYSPSDNFLRNIFVPVCRLIAIKSGTTYLLQQFDSGYYYEDLRGITGAEGGGSAASEHNNLPGLQGGTANEYYHLSSANHTDLTDAGDSALHYHSTDRARANHTGTQTASTISDFDTEVSNNSDVADNTTHRTSNGSDHTYIDQDVTSGSSPTFDGNNFTGIDADDVDIADAGGLYTATDVEGALQENRPLIDANTAKVSNATHTGEVTGSGALTLDKTAITNRTETDIDDDDYILFTDDSDSDNLKKTKINEIPTFSRLVAEATVSVAAASITISGLDINSDGGIYDFVIAGGCSSTAFVNVYYNTDTTAANYRSEVLNANGTGITASRTSTARLAALHTTGHANHFSGTIIRNPITSLVGATSRGIYNTTSLTGIRFYSTQTVNTFTNITSITFTSTSNFNVGTVIKIYKRGE